MVGLRAERKDTLVMMMAVQMAVQMEELLQVLQLVVQKAEKWVVELVVPLVPWKVEMMVGQKVVWGSMMAGQMECLMVDQMVP